MENFIDITLVANAGVLVEYCGTGLLVDGIHHEEGHPFLKVPQRDLKSMRQGLKPFTNLDYLLFTHEHPDHFTPRYVLEHIQARPPKGVLLPDKEKGSLELKKLFNYMQSNGIYHQSLSLEPGQNHEIKLESNLYVTAIGTRHMGPQYQNIFNDCFLLSLSGCNILFTGDADHIAQYYEYFLSDIALDVVFVNPIFFHNPKGQEIINTIFKAKHIIIYHMQTSQESNIDFNYMIERDIEKYGNNESQIHILNVKRQQIRFYPA